MKKGSQFNIFVVFGDDPFVAERELLKPEAHSSGVDGTERFKRSFLTKAIGLFKGAQFNYPKRRARKFSKSGLIHQV